MPSRTFERDLTINEKVGLVSGEISQHLSINWNLRFIVYKNQDKTVNHIVHDIIGIQLSLIVSACAVRSLY